MGLSEFSASVRLRLCLSQLLTVNAVDVMAVDGHQSPGGEVENGTYHRPGEQQETTADPVDDREYTASRHDENDVLNDGRSESCVSSLEVVSLPSPYSFSGSLSSRARPC